MQNIYTVVSTEVKLSKKYISYFEHQCGRFSNQESIFFILIIIIIRHTPFNESV